MPNQGKNVSFQYGTQNEYDNLTTKDSNTFYITSDTKRLYLGEDLYNMPNCVIPVNYYEYYDGENHLLYQGFCEYGADFIATDNLKTEPGTKLIGWHSSYPSTSPYSFVFTNMTGALNLYPVLSDETISDSWEQIITNISNKTYKQKYKIGDTKALTLSSSGRMVMQIAAFDSDVLASDESKTAAITWISKYVLPSPHPIAEYVSYTDSSGSYSLYDGWNNSDLKYYLQNDLFEELPENLQDAIKSVVKYTKKIENPDSMTNSTNNDIAMESSTNTIWIPSHHEMFYLDSITNDPYHVIPTINTELSGCYYPYTEYGGFSQPSLLTRYRTDESHKNLVCRNGLQVSGSDYQYNFDWWLRSESIIENGIAYHWTNKTGKDANARGVNVEDNSIYVVFGFCTGEASSQSYLVKYYSENGNTLLGTERVNKNENAQGLATNPTKATDSLYKYTFLGWNNTSNSTSINSNILNNITQNLNLYAVFDKVIKDDTISDSWEEIIANCNNGTYANKYQIGDLKTIYIKDDINSNGSLYTIQMQVVAINADLLASDNTQTAPITWISKQVLFSNFRMDHGGQGYLADWSTCDIRTYLKNNILLTLPSVVQNNIKEVIKYTNKRTDDTTWTTISTIENIWLPSYREISNNTSYCENSGVQYNSIFIDNASRKKDTLGSSTGARYWTRSASGSSYIGDANSFVPVSSDGSITQGGLSANSLYKISIGFCT